MVSAIYAKENLNMLKQMIGIALISLPIMVFADAEEIVIPGFKWKDLSANAKKEESSPASQVPNEVKDVTSIDPAAMVGKALGEEENAKWTNFLSNLSACTKSTHLLKQINPALFAEYGDAETDNILGKEGEKCLVLINYFKDGDPRLSPDLGEELVNAINKYPTGLNCIFSKEGIDIIVSKYSDLLAGKPIQATADSPFSQVFVKECVPFVVIKGQKTFEDANA